MDFFQAKSKNLGKTYGDDLSWVPIGGLSLGSVWFLPTLHWMIEWTVSLGHRQLFMLLRWSEQYLITYVRLAGLVKNGKQKPGRLRERIEPNHESLGYGGSSHQILIHAVVARTGWKFNSRYLLFTNLSCSNTNCQSILWSRKLFASPC